MRLFGARKSVCSIWGTITLSASVHAPTPAFLGVSSVMLRPIAAVISFEAAGVTSNGRDIKTLFANRYDWFVVDDQKYEDWSRVGRTEEGEE